MKIDFRQNTFQNSLFAFFIFVLQFRINLKLRSGKFHFSELRFLIVKEVNKGKKTIVLGEVHNR